MKTNIKILLHVGSLTYVHRKALVRFFRLQFQFEFQFFKKFVSHTHKNFLKISFHNPNTLTEYEVQKVLSAALNENCHIAFSKKKKSTGILETSNFEKARELVNDPLDKDNLKISWYETPVPPPQKPNINMTKAQADFFELEANVLSALRKRTRTEI